MKPLITLLILFFLASCSTKVKVQKALSKGNYNEAITRAISQLRSNKDAKRKQATIKMLQEAYLKANDRDLNTIKQLKASNNPEFYKQIYETYLMLNGRQDAIKPLLPLQINDKNVAFKMLNYYQDITMALDLVCNYYYTRAQNLIHSSDKYVIRDVYNMLNYIENKNPNYKNTRTLMQTAHKKGIFHILVSISNQTDQVIPKHLEDALLDFEAYGLNQFWISYHSKKTLQNNFDFTMELKLQQITISPEQVREREITRKKEITDGWEYVLDSNGNVAKDSLGNDIKVDKYVGVMAQIKEVQQFKSSQILARVVFKNAKTQQIIESFPVDSGFVFENIFATFAGDERALDEDDIVLVGGSPLPFPSNEQMIFDNGEDLKEQLRRTISKVQF